MAKLILTSTDALWDDQTGAPHPGIVKGIQAAQAAGVYVAVISLHDEPRWFKEHFAFLAFWKCPAPDRKNGKIIDDIIAANKASDLKRSDVVVLGAKDEDFFMAVNKKVLMLRCDWVSVLGERIQKYGVSLANPLHLDSFIRILETKMAWYFESQSDEMDVCALTNAGTYNVNDAPTLILIEHLRACLKDGKTKGQVAFATHLLSSLNVTPKFVDVPWWSYYPSSDSDNKGMEVMKGFSDLARTTFKAQRSKGPLFIRHQPAPKRSKGGVANREDPSSELDTIHLSPKYRGFLDGQTVVVMDDFCTYGGSFGVAASLLRKAGAAKVFCVAMGKFGNRALQYNIEIDTDEVYTPLASGDYRVLPHKQLVGHHVSQAQLEFVNKFKEVIR